VHIKLDQENLRTATHWLIEQDPALAHVFQTYGYPPLWSRVPGFSTLAHMILEQQVSLASANAAFARLQHHLHGVVKPDSFLQIDDETLRSLGYSRQKVRYTRALAEAVIQGQIDLDALHQLDDHQVRIELCKLPGIGNWTSDVYLSECLLRADILPPGDIALLEAFRTLKGLEKRPNHQVFTEMTEHWRPWRSVGIRLLWHFYLKERGK
jgi:DNA-3-methyladenine glycosylase II